MSDATVGVPEHPDRVPHPRDARPQQNLVAEGWGSQETGPIGGIDDVLNHYGEDGWELVGLIAQAWVNYSTGLSAGTPRTAVSEYRASFKRAKS